MNCRDSESLILAERDGALTKDQLAGLSDHVAACPACRKLRGEVAAALDTYQAGMQAVPVPDADLAWRELRDRMRAPGRREKRRLAPVVWFSVPFAAAAALALALILDRPAPPPAPEPTAYAITTPPPPLHDPSFIAGADFVEAGDPDASVLVYVDRESGWLVVWATEVDSHGQG